jgi:hypothetical protein
MDFTPWDGFSTNEKEIVSIIVPPSENHLVRKIADSQPKQEQL